MRVYITVFVLLVLVGLFLAGGWGVPVGHQGSSVISEEAALLSLLLPAVEDMPNESLAECISPFAQNVSDVRPVLAALQPLIAPLPAIQPVDIEQAPLAAPLPASVLPAVSAVPAVPVSLVYFHNGPPTFVPAPVVRPIVPAFPIVPLKPTIYTVAPMPPPVVPVFIPQIVPSRVGMPKLVYPNGVVIKPKVYFPHQPARNTLRSVTP